MHSGIDGTFCLLIQDLSGASCPMTTQDEYSMLDVESDTLHSEAEIVI